MMQNHPAPRQSIDFHQYTLITYIVFFVSAVVSGGLLSIVGVVMAYIKREEMRGTIYYEHMQFLIRTFWITLIASIIGAILSLVVIGLLVLLLVVVWHIYRLVLGMVRLYEHRTVNPYAWLEF